MNTNNKMKFRDLVRFATMAANGHNTQPWKFALKPDGIEIHPDYSRRLPVVDPYDRALWISLGCALENLLVAARTAGYSPLVTYPQSDDHIDVRLTAEAIQPSPLFEAIASRQNTRSEYDGRPVQTTHLEQLRGVPMEPGVTFHLITDRVGMETVLEYVRAGDQTQYADREFIEELIAWLRFNRKEAQASRDGLFSRCSGNPEVPRWLGRRVVGGTRPQQQADTDSRKIRSSSGAVLIASESDDPTSWVRTGQVYERLALKMACLDIKSAFVNQPIEVEALRSQFRSAMELGTGLPQLLLRFGYAPPMPVSMRRPVEDVILKS